MKLIKVETKGFKSFADRTILTFDGGIVGIVGPNGSGKSNINDAIKWVLGESSAKSLRGDTMEDVIFAGSKKTPALDKAEVSLTFDNSEKKISLPHSKITITRILKRGAGANEYYINGEVARKADIQEIAMETGIGKSSLAIISQGTISDIAQATPEQRRGIFEEAAGTSKYKKKKKQAMSKLNKTTEALEKIKAVVNELDRQLLPLRRQADKARTYLEKHEKLKDVEIGLIVEDVSFFKTQLEILEEKLEDHYSMKDDLNQRINKIAREQEAKTQHKLVLENDMQKLNAKLEILSDKITSLGMKDSTAVQRRKLIMEGQIEATPKAKLVAMKEELQSLSEKIAQYKSLEEKFGLQIIEKRTNVGKTQSTISVINSERDLFRTKFSKAKAKIDILKEYRNNRTNLFQGTRVIHENKHLFNGYLGIVADLIDVPSEYQGAIEAALGNALQNIVVEDSDVAVKGVNFLRNNRSGRATFIPLSSISPKGLRAEHEQILKRETGFVGIASDLISVKTPRLGILKRFLLGNIIVADTIENGTQLSKLLNKRYMVITVSGDVIRVGGVISGGQKTKTRELMGMEAKIQKFEEIIPTYEVQINAHTDEITKLKELVNEEQTVIAELNIESAKVVEKRTNLEMTFNSLKTTYESKTNTKLELDEVEIEMESIELIESERSSLKASLKAKRDSIMNINQDLSTFTIEKTQLDKMLRDMMEDSQASITQKNQAEFMVKNHRQRLSEEYELTVEAAQGNYALLMDREEAREIVSTLRYEIKELGHINIDSIDQYEEVSARHEKLKTSEEELFSAQQTILSAISEMDQIIITKFTNTVNSVNEEIGDIFRTMFGGGDASLKFTNPSNMLETGIEVVAQPPGKTVKNLKLFSGGEKALVAISLLFAILKTKPLPLCLLDEVEAALDDANVVRYAEFLKELKEKTQFIVVTHRAGTMSRVDHLFGATMQNRGVTSFFTVNLADAKKMVEE